MTDDIETEPGAPAGPEEPPRPTGWRRMNVREAFAQQPLPPEPDWSPLAGVLLFIGALFIPGSFAAFAVAQVVPRSAGGAYAGAIVAYLVVLLVMGGWLQVRHPGWAARMGRPVRAAVDMAVGICWGLAVEIFAVQVFAQFLLEPLLNLIFTQVPAPNQIDPAELSASGVAVAGVYAIVVAPVVEEFVFRGVLFRGLRAKMSFVTAAAISAVAFGAIHVLPGQSLAANLLLIVTMMVVGFSFAWIVERRATLLAAISAHMAFNVIGFIGIVWRH